MIERQENRLIFGERVNEQASGEYLALETEVLSHGYDELVLDFSNCIRAYPDAMVPIVARALDNRSRGIACRCILPEDPPLARLYLNTNWAHLIDPRSYQRSDLVPDRHLPVQVFGSAQEQNGVVNAAMDIVIRHMNLDRAALAGLEWSLNEITDNVLEHAHSDFGGLVQVSTFADVELISFVVADAGRGIFASMQEAHPHIRDEADAIAEAVKQGVTGGRGQGNGLAGTLQIATITGGSFKITSGRAHLNVYRPVGEAEYVHHPYARPFERSYGGTVVATQLGTSAPMSLTDALDSAGIGYAEWDIIDSQYTAPTEDALILRMNEETSGFGSRSSGAQVRQKAMNLLRADPHARLIVDWEGVQLVSSSFADEAIAKLFIDLGPVAFTTRVEHRHIEHVVRSLVDRAILQRVAHQAGKMNIEL